MPRDSFGAGAPYSIRENTLRIAEPRQVTMQQVESQQSNDAFTDQISHGSYDGWLFLTFGYMSDGEVTMAATNMMAMGDNQ